jgi:hypothetical protein
VNLSSDTRAIPIPEEKARAQISGKDGNAFAVMGRAMAGMRHAGYSPELIQQYQQEAMDGDYPNLLAVTMDYVDDSSERNEDPDQDDEEWPGDWDTDEPDEGALEEGIPDGDW